MKAAVIIAGMLAVDAAALLWMRDGLLSGRAAWRKLQLRVKGDDGFHRDR